MKTFYIILAVSIVSSIQAKVTKKRASSWDKYTFLHRVHIPDYNCSSDWVFNYEFGVYTLNRIINKVGLDYRYRVNDVSFYHLSDAKRYIKEIEKKAKNDNIDLEITSFKDKREYTDYDCRKLKYHVDRWHINPAPKESVIDYVGHYKMVLPDNLKVPLCHTWYTHKVRWLEKRALLFTNGKIIENYVFDYTDHSDPLKLKKAIQVDDHHSELGRKLYTKLTEKFSYMHNYSLNNGGFYTPKIYVDKGRLCGANHSRYDVVENHKMLQGLWGDVALEWFEHFKTNRLNYYKKFEELKNNSKDNHYK